MLNFIIPGAGLWYLGRPLWGLMNFIIVTVVGFGIAVVAPQFFNESLHYIIVTFAAGSGGLAHAVAQRTSSKTDNGAGGSNPGASPIN